MQGHFSTARQSLVTLAILAALFAALMTAGMALTPPPVRAEAQAGQFDARAARERLVRILGPEAPRPIDSDAQDAVREAILQDLASAGITAEVRDEFACRPQPGGPLVDCARARNIVFSIGPEAGPAILAAAHYDSVPAGPGASDDGIGVSVWLEIAHMLARAPLERRVIFLFSDGEEPALLGAMAFAESDPLMEPVETIINLEARGSRGPAIFFESNQPNADAVAAYASAPRPVANSVMADVYRILPNFTDVSVLTRPGVDVVNVALLDGLEDYHTPHDTIASQDLRSVQHLGDTALAVLQRFANGADQDSQTSMAYADVASRHFVYAPAWVVLAGLGLSALLSLIAFWRTGADGRWRVFVTPPLAVIVAGALAFGADFLIRILRPGENYAFAHPEPTRAWCILLAFAGIILVAMILRGARKAEQSGAAAMFWFAVFGGAASLVAPGISILFALPAAAFSLAWLISLAWKPADQIGQWLSALTVLIVWAPVLYLVELALGFDLPLAFTILVTLLLLPWLGVLASVQRETPWRVLVGASAVAAVAAIVFAIVTPSRTEARPQAFNLNYFLSTNDNEARMLAGSAERALPPDLRDAFTAERILPGDIVDTWAAPMQAEQVPTPALQDLAVTNESGERIVRARLAMNGAYRATVRIPLTAQPLRVRVKGVETDFADTGGEAPEFMNVACQGRACDGIAIEIILAADAALDAPWYIIGQTPGHRPAAAEALRARRPSTTTPIQFGDTTITLTRFVPG